MMRHNGNTVFKNTFSLLIARGIEGLVGILMIAAISRHFGPQLYGDYAFIISLVAFLIGFTTFGIERIIIRDVAKAIQDKEKAEIIFGTALTTRWVLSFIVMVVLFGMMLTGDYDLRYKIAISVTVVSQFALTSASIYSSVFKAYEKMEYEVFISFISQLLSLLMILGAVYLDLGFISIFVALALANVLKFFLSMSLCYKKFLKPKIVMHRAEIISLIKESFILGLNVLIVQAIFRMDVFILKAFKDSIEVSLFYAPHSLLLHLQVVPIAFATALFPLFSRLSCDGSKSLQVGFVKAFHALFFLSTFIMMIGMIFAPQIIKLIYGRAFMDATLSFKILLPATIFLFLHPLLGFVLISQNKPYLLLPASFGAFLVNVSLDLVLIPKYGNVGASLASLAGYLVLFSITCYSIRHIVSIPRGRFLYIPLGALTLISSALYFFDGHGPIALTCITLLIFGMSLFVMGFVYYPSQFSRQIGRLPKLFYNLLRK
jgi:O-antigen/teichoic acid export membrane protein